MKNIFHSALLAMAVLVSVNFSVNAQDLIPDQNAKGKWGYVNSDGLKVINYNYTHASAFKDGRALVQKGGKWGYIDEHGKEVIKIKYTEMAVWAGEYCKVGVGGKVDGDGVVTGAKYGYINKAGEYVLKPEYDEIGSFETGLAYVKKDKKYGYIDPDFNLVIPCKYSAIGSYNSAGLCWVKDGNKYGVYNAEGKIIVPVKYKAIGTFYGEYFESNPLACKVVSNSEYVQKYIKLLETNPDATLADVVPPKLAILMRETPHYELPSHYFIEGKNFTELDMSTYNYILVSNYGKIQPGTFNEYVDDEKDMAGIYSSTGEELLPAGKYDVAMLPSDGAIGVVNLKNDKMQLNYYDIASKKLLLNGYVEVEAVAPFINGYAVIYKPGLNFIVDKNGDTVSKFYKYILPPKEGAYLVNENDKFGIIDHRGNELVKPTFAFLTPESEGLFCAIKEGESKFGYIDRQGNYVIRPKYDMATSFTNGYARVCINDNWGIINKEGKAIVNIKWDGIAVNMNPNKEYVWVKKDNQWNCLKIADNTLSFTTNFADVEGFDNNGYSIVQDKKGLYGCVNTAGEIIIPTGLETYGDATACRDFIVDTYKKPFTMTDVYRYNIYSKDLRNSYKLTDSLDSSVWDY